MKTILMLLTLISLVACGKNSDKDSDSYKSALHGDGTLHAKIETDITKYSTFYELLSNQSNYESVTVDGTTFYCSLEIESGTAVRYEIEGSKLIIKYGKEDQVFDRIQGTGETLNGSWENKEKQKDGLLIRTLRFNGNKLTMELACKFK